MSDASALTGFGVEIDRLARRIGEWPDDVVVYRLEALNDKQVLLEGAIPTGVRKDGSPVWKGKTSTFRVVAKAADYRRACRAAREAGQ